MERVKNRMVAVNEEMSAIIPTRSKACQAIVSVNNNVV